MTQISSSPMPGRERAALLRYLAAVAFVGVAVALRTAFDKTLGEAHPFPFFLAATAVAAWYGGIGPAVLALTLGYLAADWFFISPRQQFTDWTHLSLFSVIVYASTAVVISMAVSAAQLAKRRECQRAAADIAERKRVEQALRETGARNKAILESALDAIIVIDHESKVLEFNPAAEKIFGFTRAQILGKPMAEFIIPERFRALHYQGLAHFLATREGPVLRRRLELPALRANGEEFPAELAILPVPGSNPPTFTGFLRDLTEVKRNQEALQKAQDDLLKANRSLESKVQQRTASLQQSLKSMETVLYTIAHDLRSPNRAMEGFAQLLAREYSAQLDDTARSYIKRISDAALKNDSLICDLLEFGRLAHAELPMSNVDLGRSVQRTLQDLQEQIRARNATIELGDKWPEVWANDSVLNQIVTNLLTNALKFVAPNSPPRIRIWAEDPMQNPKSEIDPYGVPASAGEPSKEPDPRRTSALASAQSEIQNPKSKIENEMIRLYVQDHGIGIPTELHGRLFQPFQRGTADPQYQGTGMGLAIVQKGAERLGGKVGFSSTPGQGTSFWVELLPARAVQPGGTHEQSDIASPSMTTKTIFFCSKRPV